MDKISPASNLSEATHRQQLRRAVIASVLGTTVEWYDFELYSIVTALVFAKLFFPKSDALVGFLEAFSIYTVGFVARPIGSVVFGHYGDRMGRKAALVATLVLTGFATFAVGLVPTYETIGIWGAVILVFLRFIQGIGIGGGWAGSVLLSMEWARSNEHRGYIASWPQLGAPAGLLLATTAVLVFSQISGEQFLIWGWRIPFLLSIILVGIGLYIRLTILETPVFQRTIEKHSIERPPIVELIKRQPGSIILTALLRTAEQTSSYIYLAFVFVYGTAVVRVSQNFLLTSMIVASIISLATIPVAGHLSDLFGRKLVYTIGAAMTGAYGFVYFALLNTGIEQFIFIAIVLSLVPTCVMYGPQAALIAERFPPRVRYTGASISYQLASIFSGGPAPLIATALLGAYGSGYAIALYILFGALISIVATWILPDVSDHIVTDEHGL